MMTDISQIWQFDLRQGNSHSPREGACLLDAVSWLEYGTLGDHPECVCPVIATFGRNVNDMMSNRERQRLKVFIPRLVGTVDLASEQARAEYLAWQAIRVFAPLALDSAGLMQQADQLRLFDGTLNEAASVANTLRTDINAAINATNAVWAATNAVWAAANAVWAATNAVWDATNAARAATNAVWDATNAINATKAAEIDIDRQIEDAIIATLDGVLRIGRQAEVIAPERMTKAVRQFASACAG